VQVVSRKGQPNTEACRGHFLLNHSAGVFGGSGGARNETRAIQDPGQPGGPQTLHSGAGGDPRRHEWPVHDCRRQGCKQRASGCQSRLTALHQRATVHACQKYHHIIPTHPSIRRNTGKFITTKIHVPTGSASSLNIVCQEQETRSIAWSATRSLRPSPAKRSRMVRSSGLCKGIRVSGGFWFLLL